MKYVYVLTSSEKDTYYEQFFLSIVSLRQFNPRADIILLVDTATNNSLTGTRSGYEKYISEKREISVPGDFSQKEASRWIKTSIHHHVSGNFLFVDCDTIIADCLEPAFPPETKIGAILDTHVTLTEHHLRKYFQKRDVKAGFCSSFESNTYYNSGIIFCGEDEEAINFYEKWHSLWLEGRKKGCIQDQPSFNQTNYKMGNVINDLGGEWNCQISHNGLPFLADAKIIHYYATSLASLEPAYKFASSTILASIKQSGELPAEVMRLLENPKAAFEPLSRIISDRKIIHALDHSLFFKLIRLKNRMGL